MHAENGALDGVHGIDPEENDSEEYDDGTEERRLVIVEETSELDSTRADEEEDQENVQPLDLSLPRRGIEEGSSNVPASPALGEPGSSRQSNVSVVDTTPFVQGQ